LLQPTPDQTDRGLQVSVKIETTKTKDREKIIKHLLVHRRIQRIHTSSMTPVQEITDTIYVHKIIITAMNFSPKKQSFPNPSFYAKIFQTLAFQSKSFKP